MSAVSERSVPPPVVSERPVPPVIFIGHGAPTTALDVVKGVSFRVLGRTMPRPTAILAVSAHWEAAPPAIGTSASLPLIYDFYGFPEALYQVQYPAPGAPELARRVRELLAPGTREAPQRGLDHGVWTPLVHMFPAADIPVLQVSLPTGDGPRAVYELGRKLAPLRAEGVLLYGSGNITHNLRRVAPDGSAPEGWASDYDAWVVHALAHKDVDALIDAPQKGPAYHMNHPSADHWLPFVFALGAGADLLAEVAYPVTGFEFGNLSRRAVTFG